MKSAIAAAALLAIAGAANAQVVITEVLENPPGGAGSTDARWEFIELYGKPGLKLDGYAIGLLKGGRDPDGTDQPASSDPDDNSEIDEAFSLDGFQIGPNGFLVLFNGIDSPFGLDSFVPNFLTPNPAFDMAQPVSATNPRFLDGEEFQVFHIPIPSNPNEDSGALNNDGSSSYVLVRRRPNHSLDMNGMSIYAAGYAFAKETIQDIDFDGKADFGTELGPFFIPDNAPHNTPLMLQPFQMVDDLAWSNDGGKEYVQSSEQEISDTPGFNPDTLARINFFLTNPNLGTRLNSDEEVVPTRMADEEWIYGELLSVFSPQNPAPTDTQLLGQVVYDAAEVGAPTDPNGDGFQDIDVTGFEMTPGSFNDHPSNPNIRQFRFVPGDVNFDFVVDCQDVDFAQTLVGATLDDITPDIDPSGVPFDRYVYQGRAFQQILIVINMDEADGLGSVNDVQVTQADVDAIEALAGGCCPTDVNNSGSTDIEDLLLVLREFGVSDGGDTDGNGTTDIEDLLNVLREFGNNC